MKLHMRGAIICLLCLVQPVLVFSASELTFDSSARPAMLVLGGKDMLQSGSSAGFNLRYSNGKEVTDTQLSKISRSGNKIRVSDPNGQSSFTFRIDTYDNHLAIHLLDMQGIGTGRNYSLSLELDSKDVAAYTLNDLMTANAGNQRRRKGNNTVLNWPYLWGRPRPNGTRGSVVLYNNRLSGSARDAVLAEIWSAQGTAGHMVRPAGQATWTQADVLSWVEQWVAKFSKIATVSVSAENKAELYKMTDTYVLPSGANRVYMFCPVWRGEYKLNYQTMVDINTRIFPNGKSDLIAYSEYLAKHGAHLQLKSLGPQIGRNDERYISSSSVDRRLMSWCTGTLAEDVDPSATTIRFRLASDPILRARTEGPMRLGEEIISAGRIRRTDDVWVLENCERGYGASTAKSHRAGTEMQGIVLSNNVINFEDDFGLPNSIAEEICGEYGDFLNELNVGHLHFDGSGRMHIYPWYVRDFTDYIYSRVDQPVTGSTVGGGIPANFEKQFSGAKAISGATAYHLVRIGPRLHERGRKHTELAPSILDLHFDVSDGIRIGSRRPTFCGGQSGKLLSMETLNNYGLTDYAFGLFKYWVELAPVFDDADADYVAGFLLKGGNHYKGEDVLVLSKDGNGDYIYTPHRVMGRTSGKDPLIHIDQEWGAVPCFQNIKAGTTMELLNPYEQQQPQVVIRVEHGSKALRDPHIKVNGKGELVVKGEIQPNEYMKFEGGSTVKVYDNNWNLLRSLPAMTHSFTVNKGNNTVTTAAGSGSDTPDLRVQFITLGPVYVLESNKHLSDTFWTAYFEAEHFSSQTGGNKASTEYFPYIGKGYLEMGGQGATVTWDNITVPKAGKYTLILKYANNTTQDRPCDLKVNGALIKNIPFDPFKKTWAAPWPAATGYNSKTVGWAKYWNARVIVDLNAGANTLELIATSAAGGPHIDNIGVSTAVSEPPAPVVNVEDHGAVGDGSTDNSEAIANAIAACPAGGSVVFDEGIYMTGSITLKANMTLWVSENTVIRAIQDNDKIQTYPEGAFAGESFKKYFLFGNQVDNLTITGGGTINGNAVGGYLVSPKHLRPVLLGFINSKNVTVTNLDLLYSHSWLFIPRESDNVIIDGINLHNTYKDGIAPLDCHNMRITNSVISSGDDALTPKSYSSKGIDNLVVKNLTINHCKWKGIKFGFSSVGDFKNSLFEDIAMVHVQAGITLLSIDGSNVSNLTFNRINMNNVLTPITLLNGGGLRSKAPGITTMKDVTISNLDVRNVWDPMGSFITGTKVGNTIHKVENIYLTNVKVNSFKGGLTTVPGTPIEYDGRRADVRLFGNFPAWGYYIRHADNVVFKNVTHSVSPEDAREDIVLEDVTGFETVGLGNSFFLKPKNE